MQTETQSVRLRIFVDEQDRRSGKPVYETLVAMARREGLAGVTVIHGTEGMGSAGIAAVPVVVEIVDDAEAIERILPLVGEIVGEGIATIDPVRMIRYTKDEERAATVGV